MPPRTVMSGELCLVEILDPEKHAEELFVAYVKKRNDRDWTYLPYGPFDSFENYLKWMNNACTSKDPLFHVIKDAITQKALGVASYLRIEPILGVVEVGHIHFSPVLQKTPHATEAMFLMMSRVFDELGFVVMNGNVTHSMLHPENQRSDWDLDLKEFLDRIEFIRDVIVIQHGFPLLIKIGPT